MQLPSAPFPTCIGGGKCSCSESTALRMDSSVCTLRWKSRSWNKGFPIGPSISPLLADAPPHTCISSKSAPTHPLWAIERCIVPSTISVVRHSWLFPHLLLIPESCCGKILHIHFVDTFVIVQLLTDDLCHAQGHHHAPGIKVHQVGRWAKYKCVARYPLLLDTIGQVTLHFLICGPALWLW